MKRPYYAGFMQPLGEGRGVDDLRHADFERLTGVDDDQPDPIINR
jgi:hypothetical protein